jgi:homoserine dehydrogenase
MTTPLRIGIAGLGTVGLGVIRMLRDNADLVMSRAGRQIDIVAVSARDAQKNRGVDLSGITWVTDARDMASRADISAIVEVIGGEGGISLDLAHKTLISGKHLITANKAMLAHHGTALARLAENHNVSVLCEAAVAGGIPIIKTFREGLAGNHIRALYGILNGTCNYILTEMRLSGRSFTDVLTEAQEKGYAESDPSFDIDGIDTGHKLCLLCSMAFGVMPQFLQMSMTGISHLTPSDMQYAGELGYRIKLLGMARCQDGQVWQKVMPCLVPSSSTLGNVEGVYNAVFYETDFAGQGMMSGRGAGADPTASAIVSDIIDLAQGKTRPLFGVPVDRLTSASMNKPQDISSRFYMHLRVKDQAGVIAEISSILKDHNISIESMIQRGRHPDQAVSVVMITHETNESDMASAYAKMSRLSFMAVPPTQLMIKDIS